MFWIFCVSGYTKNPAVRSLSCHADSQQALWVESLSITCQIFFFTFSSSLLCVSLYFTLCIDPESQCRSVFSEIFTFQKLVSYFKKSTSFLNVCLFLYCPPVTRRCFPALGQKGGVITVGNNSQFDDGSGKMRDAKDLVDGVKWVHHWNYCDTE